MNKRHLSLASTTQTSMFPARFLGPCCALVASIAICSFVGCGAEYSKSVAHDAATAAEYESLPNKSTISGLLDSSSSTENFTSKSSAKNQADQDLDQVESNKATRAKQNTLNRKIIYNTKIGLVVKDYQAFETDLPQLVNSFGGFVASNKTKRRYNNSQSGTWIVRLPVSEYTNFLAGVTSLGFAESRSENAQDVTEEFVDVQARVKNKKQLEARILKMLEERNGKLTDVLEIERELSRVREEVERMEGRLRFLKDRTSLATVTISCREEKEYVPAAAPTLASRASKSWSDSIGALQSFGSNLLVGAIGATPWLIVFGSLFVLAVLVIRRFSFWQLVKRNS